MNDEQTPALRQAVENMATMREAYDNLSQAAEAYNVGKTQLAAAISSKGVETSPTETYPEMAEKVNAISQETYEINGGEMYAKQLFGSVETPNYWNLYEVLAQLLSDGRLVNYGGILLAEYYRGYDSLALAGSGSGGAYVVSDKDENGQFKMYTEDTTHTWATEFDGKGNRWVAYCFADEGHEFQITNTNTSPRSIYIGRNVGTISSLVAGRCSEIVVPDGSTLNNFTGNYDQSWNRKVVLRNINQTQGSIIFISSSNPPDFVYYKGNLNGGNLLTLSNGKSVNTVIMESDSALNGSLNYNATSSIFNVTNILLKSPSIDLYIAKGDCICPGTKTLSVTSEQCTLRYDRTWDSAFPAPICYFSYITNDKTKSFTIGVGYKAGTKVILKNRWCKPLSISTFVLDEDGMYTGILQRLKQDEPDCGDGVTITLGATNLAKLTSQESVDLLDLLTNTYGYTFA